MTKKFWKSEKGFTIQDLVLAVAILLLFAGLIGSMYVAIYQTQAHTAEDNRAIVFAVQIMEQIDKIGYDEITDETKNEVITDMRQEFSVPSKFAIQLDIIPYLEDDIVKTVKMTMNYQFLGKERVIAIERLKVKEK